MRQVFGLLFLILICPVLLAQDAPEKAAVEVRSVLDKQVQAWNRKDLEAFMAGYWNSPDLTFFSGARPNQGWQSALDHYRKAYQGDGREMGKLAFVDLQIEMLGADSAFVRGGFQLTMSDGKTPHGLFTLIFRRFPEGWRIVHDHSCGE
jgi:beta-aspartyl-peptidase (threonine type)